MTPFLIYLLKVNVGIVFLYAAYYLLLRKEKFFRLNRIILLSVILLPFLLPLLPSLHSPAKSPLQHGVFDFSPFYDLLPVDLPADHHRLAGQQEITVTASSPAALASPFTLQQLLESIYALVVLVLTARLVIQLYHLRKYIRHSRRRKAAGIIYCYHDQPLPPFSFFRYLVLNESSFKLEQLPSVIAHEKVHIKEGHTADLLLIEFLHALFWINPCIIGLKRAIKLNLEYMADEKVLETGLDARIYQYSILSCMKLSPLPLTNPFTASKIKLRIYMMNTKRTPMRNLYKYALALPLLAGAYLITNPIKATAMPLPGSSKVLSPAVEELKAFEGYYQLSKGEEAYIQITASGKQLILKQLWDNKEIRFDQKSELEFSGQDGRFPLKFSKSPDGDITSVLAFNKDLWKKVKKYKPVATITLPSEQLKPFEGFYHFSFDGSKESYIQILSTGEFLILRQGWDGQEISFLPTSETSFYSKEKAFPLEFTKDANGNVTQVLAFHKDLWKRLADPSEAVIKKGIMLDEGQLRPLEGKYHMKTEKGEDSYVQISQANHGLLLKQGWDNAEVQLTAESPTSFFSKERAFSIVFTLDSNGTATGALAFDKDHWEKVKE